MFLLFLARYKLLIEILAIGALVAGLAYAVHKFFDSLREEGAQKERAVWVERDRKADALVAQREKDLLAQKTKSDKEKEDALSSLRVSNAALAASLRNRPDRPGITQANQPAGTPEVAKGCTGAELYRPDGEFLGREAARADRLAIELSACYSQYDNAREALKAIK
jgi:hypothetical protein